MSPYLTYLTAGQSDAAWLAAWLLPDQVKGEEESPPLATPKSEGFYKRV
jgi:hypothetical protein